MIVIIAGSKSCKDEKIIEEAILQGIEKLDIKPKTFIHGNTPGVDVIGGKICKKMGYNVISYPAKWKDIKGKPESEIKENNYGKYWVKAGFERNQKMADSADALIAINLGTGGAEDIIQKATKAGLKIYTYEPESEECFGFDF